VLGRDAVDVLEDETMWAILRDALLRHVVRLHTAVAITGIHCLNPFRIRSRIGLANEAAEKQLRCRTPRAYATAMLVARAFAALRHGLDVRDQVVGRLTVVKEVGECNTGIALAGNIGDGNAQCAKGKSNCIKASAMTVYRQRLRLIVCNLKIACGKSCRQSNSDGIACELGLRHR